MSRHTLKLHDRSLVVELSEIEVSRICTALIRTGSDADLNIATRIRLEFDDYYKRNEEGR